MSASACISAVKKSTSKLVRLLSAQVVGLREFGQALLDAKFVEQSGLNNVIDSSLAPGDKAFKLSQIIKAQVEQKPKVYYKAYLSVLERFPSLHSLLKTEEKLLASPGIFNLLSINLFLITVWIAQLIKRRNGRPHSTAILISTTANSCSV